MTRLLFLLLAIAPIAAPFAAPLLTSLSPILAMMAPAAAPLTAPLTPEPFLGAVIVGAVGVGVDAVCTLVGSIPV